MKNIKHIVVTILIVLFWCEPAQTEQLDFSQILIDEHGEQMIEDGKPVTFEQVCIISLLRLERDLTDTEKYIRYDLYKKIQNGDHGLTLDEKVKLKKIVSKHMPTLVAGQARDWIESEQQ